MANGDPEFMGLSKLYVPGGDPNYAAPMLVLSEAEAQKYAAWLNEYNEKMGRPVVKFSVPERADLFGEALAERDAEIAALKTKVVEYAKDALLDAISDISETYWAASWQEGIVAELKKAVTDPAADRHVWGRVQLSEAEVIMLSSLAADAGGWPDEELDE